jgi:hypothetical protein
VTATAVVASGSCRRVQSWRATMREWGSRGRRGVGKVEELSACGSGELHVVSLGLGSGGLSVGLSKF